MTEPVTESTPHAENSDGSFQLRIAGDGMSATLEALKPANAAGKPVTVEQVMSALKQHNISHGINTERITEAITALNSSEQNSSPQQPIIIATGDTATPSEDGRLQWHIDEEQLTAHTTILLPGELIATYKPATAGKHGKDIYGKPVTATPGTNSTVNLGDGIEKIPAEQGEEYRAEWFGVLQSDGQRVYVDPAISISDDAMAAYMDLHIRATSGATVGLNHILAALDKQGIKHGIDQAAIQQALIQPAATADDHCTKGLLVAKGTPPQPGKDARMVLSQDNLSAGKAQNDGSIDFHEHGYPHNVKKGETVGYLLEAKNGINGTDVQGKTIEAPAPKVIEPELTGLHKGDRGKLVADIDGALIITGSRLEIVELLIINGDVALKTGNIRSDIPVHVKGHVEPGFTLESTKDVIIEKNVEDATVRSGGDVVIKGGIRGKHSELFAPGDINVGFIENAKVFVNGNITIRASIINSEVASNSTIIIGDKRARHSAVMGGTVTAHTLVEAFTLGAPSFAKTLIRVGIAQETRRQLNKLESGIETKQKELDSLALLEKRYTNSMQADAATLMHKIQITRAALLAEISTLTEQQSALLTELKQSESAKVVVHKNILPGVTLCINEQCLEISHELGKGTFTLTDGKITFHPG